MSCFIQQTDDATQQVHRCPFLCFQNQQDPLSDGKPDLESVDTLSSKKPEYAVQGYNLSGCDWSCIVIYQSDIWVKARISPEGLIINSEFHSCVLMYLLISRLDLAVTFQFILIAIITALGPNSTQSKE